MLTKPCSLQLVATYHCDQAYAFDVSATGACTTAFTTSASSALPATSGGSDAVMEDAGPIDPASQQAQGVPPRQAHLLAPAATSAVIMSLILADHRGTCML